MPDNEVNVLNSFANDLLDSFNDGVRKGHENARALIFETEDREVIHIDENPPDGDLHLDPCPFCGSSNIIYWQYNTVVGPRWRIFCLHCNAGVDPGWAQQRNPLTDIWNRRDVI